jgi:ParB family chromosome partitioning protein
MASLKARFQKIAAGKTTLGFDPLANDAARLSYIRVEEIERDPEQPRQDLGDLEELKRSIREHGILQPVVISPLDERRYRLIAGERRLTAARQLVLPTIPALIRSVQDHERLELQLIENLHRKDLNPFEEARGYQRLIDEFNLTQERVAQRIGRSVASINQVLRLLDLPEFIKAEFQTSEKVSKSVLLEIAKQTSEQQQRVLWSQAKQGQLTVRQARLEKVRKRVRKEAPISYTIQTTHATVVVRFHKGAVTQAGLISVLREALKLQTRQQKDR